ncbi:uncharacterized protein LOC142591108 [Dermacentor variabilis]|uniref:uncharacterized protein LOC142591108 n=1 Tax=Dermacentor variabilis TaxID=34621 RepID=UPI003F5AF268
MILYILLLAGIPLFPAVVSATDVSQCAKVSLPNFLGIGECLGGSADLCSADTEGIGDFLGTFLRCTFQGLGTLNLRSQTYLIIEFLKYLLARNDFDVLLPLLTGVCEGITSFLGLLTGGIVSLSCDELQFDIDAVCSEPITMSLPTTTSFRKCLNSTGLTCVNNTPVDEPAILGFLRVLACLVRYVLDTAPSEIVKQLGCDLVGIVYSIRGSGSVTAVSPLICALERILNIECSVVQC